MKKYIFFICLIFLLSCSSFNINDVNKRDRPKFDFVLQLMENPEKIEEICKNVNGFSIKYFIDSQLSNPNKKNGVINYYILLLTKYKKAGYKIYCDFKYEICFKENIIDYCHDIDVEGSGIMKLINFRWKLKNGEWVFINIDVIPEHYCGE